MAEQRLSTHFTLDEVQCKCGCGKGGAHPQLLVLMELVRGLNGNKPITPSSVYRCSDHNAAVGGSDSSYHLKGMAADMPVDNPKFVYSQLYQVFPHSFGFGLYDSFVHVDCRNGVARWQD